MNEEPIQHASTSGSGQSVNVFISGDVLKPLLYIVLAIAAVLLFALALDLTTSAALKRDWDKNTTDIKAAVDKSTSDTKGEVKDLKVEYRVLLQHYMELQACVSAHCPVIDANGDFLKPNQGKGRSNVRPRR